MEDHVYEYDSINNNNNNIYSAPPSTSSKAFHDNHSPSSSDEISQFLHQILYRSSSSIATTTATATSSSGMDHMVLPLSQENAHRLSKSTGISTVDSVNTSAGGVYLSGNVGVGGANVSSSSVGVSENENTDEHDCQSEGVEPLDNDVQPKSERPRNSSKRSRAAEVHNLSEKRRRSRINEKMKALQNLIPNSNKTDKASMLDEAIEYLKHLQLQVQVLTMRNGLSVHPMCLPGGVPPIQFSQMRMGIGAENGSLHTHSTGTLVNQETPMPNVFNLSNQCASSNQLQLPNVSNIINSETSFWVDSSIEANCGAFHLGTSSGETSRLNMLPNQQLNASHSETGPLALATVLHPFSTQGSDQNLSGSFEACMIGGYQAEGVLLKNIERNNILPPPMNSMQPGRNFHADHMKQERKHH